MTDEETPVTTTSTSITSTSDSAAETTKISEDVPAKEKDPIVEAGKDGDGVDGKDLNVSKCEDDHHHHSKHERKKSKRHHERHESKAKKEETKKEEDSEHNEKHHHDDGGAAEAKPSKEDADSDEPDKEKKDGSSEEKKPEKEEKFKPYIDVIIHVYDLSQPVNDKLFRVGLGLYHSGVELEQLDLEYWFQGHDQRYTGILEINHPMALRAIPYVRESINLGKTPRTPAEIEEIVDRLTLEYRGCTYNVLRHNCNAFCIDFVKALEPEKKFPSYINRLANMGSGLVRIVPDSLLWWSMGKFGVSKSSVEIEPQPEDQEPCIDERGAVLTFEELKLKEEASGKRRKPEEHKDTEDKDEDGSKQASYQSLSGASEGVALLDRRGKDDSEAAAAAAKAVGHEMYGPVHLMTAKQQRMYARTLFIISLEQMEQRMIEEQLILQDEELAAEQNEKQQQQQK